MVDDTQTTEQSHVDGHVVLSDSVHGRRQKRSFQRDALGNGGVQSDIGGREAYISQILLDRARKSRIWGRLTDVTGEDEEVIVGQSSVLVGVQKSVHVQPILRGIGLRNLNGLGVVLDLSLHGGTRRSLLVGDGHNYVKEGISATER